MNNKDCPACSSDYGKTWTRKGQMLTVGLKPTTPTWAGIGDFDVVWDWQQSRWNIELNKTLHIWHTLDGFCWHQKWEEPSLLTQAQLLKHGGADHIKLCILIWMFLENGMVEILQGIILLRILHGSQIFMVKDCQTVNILQSTGTGIIRRRSEYFCNTAYVVDFCNNGWLLTTVTTGTFT